MRQPCIDAPHHDSSLGQFRLDELQMLDCQGLKVVLKVDVDFQAVIGSGADAGTGLKCRYQWR